jgi:hypothetical protein
MPAALTGGRDELMFRAGQARAGRQLALWRGASTVLAILAVVPMLTVWRARGSARPIVERRQASPLIATTSAPPTATVDPNSYLGHRTLFLSEDGNGAIQRRWPFTQPVQRAAPAVPTYQELRRNL